MSIGDYVYIVVIALFSWMTFAIVRGNFQRKFNNDGERLDLIEEDKKSQSDSSQ